MSEIMRYESRYRINKLSVSGRTGVDKLSRETERALRLSKRIVLVFTQDFIEDEFKNRTMLIILKELAKDDPNCVLVAINKGLDAKLFDYCVDYLESPSRDTRSFERSGYYQRMSLCLRLASHVKYNCGLRDVERLDYLSNDFRKYFLYTLPILDFNDTGKKCKLKKSNFF